ncbi:hypothetical protein HOY80DRAFT_654923 [Tuber brumale]|nr:hypothetical protein HOY80DRAFT_654923 [Tuber brumale]
MEWRKGDERRGCIFKLTTALSFLLLVRHPGQIEGRKTHTGTLFVWSKSFLETKSFTSGSGSIPNHLPHPLARPSCSLSTTLSAVATTTLLHYYTTTLLHYYTTTLLHYCTTTLLHYYTTTLLRYYYFTTAAITVLLAPLRIISCFHQIKA